MATVVRAEAKITAQNALRPGLNSAISDLKRFRQAADQLGKMQGLQETLANMGRYAAGAAGAFIAYQGLEFAKRSVKDFANLQREMTRIGITGDNASPDEVTAGIERLREVAMQTATPIKDLREGMSALTSAGVNFQDSLDMMPAVARTAQASGSKMEDIANSSLAIIRHLKVETKDLQAAQDMITRGGELGQFELKDMARYLPSMAPAAKAVGMEGKKGLAYMVAMLQVIREGTGTAEEAASSASNIFQKMESEETTNKFKKMGVDLRKEMAQARKNGENLVDAFVRITDKALKGDLSKIPQLFTDSEFARGMRAMLVGIGKMPGMIDQIANSAGAVNNNLRRITGDTQAALDRFSESADRARVAFGALAAEMAAPSIDGLAKSLQTIATDLERIKKIGVEAEIERARKEAAAQGDPIKAHVQRMKDAAALENMEERHIEDSPEHRMRRNAIRLLEGMPKRNAEQEATLLQHKEWMKNNEPPKRANPAELKAFSRKLGSDLGTGVPGPNMDVLREYQNEQMYLRFEADRARNRMSPFKPHGGKSAPTLPIPPTRKNRPVTFDDVPMQGFEAAVPKVEAVKTAVDNVATAAQAPGPALAASIGAGVDQAITHIDRLESRLRNIKMPTGSHGFPTGPTMREVE